MHQVSRTSIPWRDPRPALRRPVRAISPLAVAAGLAGALVLLVAAALVAAVLAVQAYGLILPGTRVGSTRLDWKTRAQAAQLLDRTWNQDRLLVITDGTRTWSTTPAFLGLWMDPGETAQAAYAVGRSGTPDANPLAAIRRIFSGETIEVRPVARVDADYARAQLVQWAAMINVPPVDAGLAVESGKLVSSPAQDGLNLDVETTFLSLLADPVGILERGSLKIRVQPVAARVRDVSNAITQAEVLLNRPITAAAYDPVTNETLSWTVPQEVVASWLRVETGPDGPVVSIDSSQAGWYLAGLESQLGPGCTLDVLPAQEIIDLSLNTNSPIPLRLRHLPTEYVIQPGDTMLKIGWKTGMPYWRIVNSNPGLDPEQLNPGRTLVIPPKDELLPLPVVPGKRIVISIGSQRMRIYQDSQQIREFVISTGIDRSPTQPGIFQVQTHELSAYASVWDLTMPHFLGIYEAWPGFMNGIHGLPTLSNGNRLWGSILGRPASYGCIILDLASAEWLYAWAEDGVVVEILE